MSETLFQGINIRKTIKNDKKREIEEIKSLTTKIQFFEK